MNIISTHNPYTLEKIAEYHTLDTIGIAKMLQRSQDAFVHWKATDLNIRKAIFEKAAQLLRMRREEYATLISTEMGKVISESKAEVDKCAHTIEFFSTHIDTYIGDVVIPSSARKNSYLRFEPTGAVLAIMPWNYPFWQVIRYAVPAMLSGNVSILKHAPNVLGCGLILEKLFLDAGLPEGVFQTAIIDVESIEQLIAHDTVQGVTLTGSEKAGSSVAMLAGKHIKKSVLELGGSDPFIVLDDANIEEAAKVAVQARMMNAGQACICAKRFIVTKKVTDLFIDKFITHLHKIQQGNPLDPNTQMGPMARLDLAQKVESQAQSSLQKGAVMLQGGQRKDCFYAPSLITNLQAGMPVYDEEVFGPLASLIVVDNDEQAIRVANQSRYGLGAAIWSRDIEKAQVLAQQLEVGAVFVNALVHSDARLPFGGIKKSGYGRELGEIGCKEFLNIKTVYVNDSLI